MNEADREWFRKEFGYNSNVDGNNRSLLGLIFGHPNQAITQAEIDGLDMVSPRKGVLGALFHGVERVYFEGHTSQWILAGSWKKWVENPQELDDWQVEWLPLTTLPADSELRKLPNVGNVPARHLHRRSLDPWKASPLRPRLHAR